MKPDLGLSGCNRTHIFDPEEWPQKGIDFEPLLYSSGKQNEKKLYIGSLDWEPDQLPCSAVVLSCVCKFLALACMVAAGTLVHWQGGSVLGLLLGRCATQLVVGTFLWTSNIGNIRDIDNMLTTSMFGEPLDRSRIFTSGLLYYVLLYTWWRGLLVIPLGDALALMFALAPLVMSLLAKFMHNQPLHRFYFVPVVLTIAGGVILTQPPIIFGPETATWMQRLHDLGIGLSTDINSSDFRGLLFLGASTLFAAVIGSSNWSYEDQPHWLQLDIVAAVEGLMITPFLLGIDLYIFQDVRLSGATWTFDLVFVGCSITLGLLGLVGSGLEEFSKNLTIDDEGFGPRLALFDMSVLVLAYVGQSYASNEIPNYYKIIGATLLVASIVIQYFQIRSDDPLGVEGTQHYHSYGGTLKEYKVPSDLPVVDGGGETFRAQQFSSHMTQQQKLFAMKERVTVMLD